MRKARSKRSGWLLYGSLFVLTYVALFLLISPWLQPLVIMQHTENFQIHHFEPTEWMVNQLNAEPVLENFYEIVEPDLQMVLSQIFEVEGTSVIGGIVIPDVDIQLPILAGTTPYNLLVGATTIGHQLTMGEGNFALAGHNMTHGGILFSRLLDISDDAHILVTDGEHIYIYQVVERAVIHQNEISVLEPTSVATITLITCDVPTVWTPNRFMVRGELVGVHDLSSESPLVQPMREAMAGSQVSVSRRYGFTLALVGIGGCASVVIGGLVLISRRDRRKLERSRRG